MNNKFQRFLLGSAVVALSATVVVFSPLPTNANAQTTGQGTPTRRPGMHHRFGEGAPLISIALRHQSELGLSTTQVANLEKIRTDYRSQITPIFQQLRGIESQIRTFSQETPADMSQIKNLIAQAEPLRSELRYLRMEALESGKSVLNTQQLDQLKNLLASMHQNFKKPQQGQAS